jgi:hypothetical protein
MDEPAALVNRRESLLLDKARRRKTKERREV